MWTGCVGIWFFFFFFFFQALHESPNEIGPVGFDFVLFASQHVVTSLDIFQVFNTFDKRNRRHSTFDVFDNNKWNGKIILR